MTSKGIRAFSASPKVDTASIQKSSVIISLKPHNYHVLEFVPPIRYFNSKRGIIRSQGALAPITDVLSAVGLSQGLSRSIILVYGIFVGNCR